MTGRGSPIIIILNDCFIDAPFANIMPVSIFGLYKTIVKIINYISVNIKIYKDMNVLVF